MFDQLYKLSPSDFAYLWEECKHCYYQKVKNGISYSGLFPAMFTRINKLLQDSVMGMNLQDIIPDLPSAIIETQEGFIRSIKIPGTNCFLNGRYDIVIKFDDGTYGVIDFKITEPDDEKVLKKYATQLHAYKFALENPESGTPIKVSKMGIISIKPESMKLENGKIIFTTTPTWHGVEEDMDGFYMLVRNISDVLSGPLPEVSETCGLCIYRSKFESPKDFTDDIPF